MATADTAKLIAQLILEDKQFQAAISRSTRSIGKLEGRFSKLGGSVSRGANAAGRNLERGLAVGLTAVGGALAYSVKQAVDAESAIAGVAKTVDGDISGVVDSLKAMSNQIPVSFGDLAGIAELGGAMGVAKDDLADFTKQVAILGTTTNVSVEDAATALGQMANVIGLTGDEFDNFSAALVDLGNKGSSTEAQILEIARRSGGAAKLIGIAKEETLGWAAAAANLGLNEELAGTAVQNFFLKTQAAITNGGADLKDLAKISGKTTKQFKKDFDKNATGALTDFLEGLGKMSKDARLKAIQQIFGKGSGLTRLIVGLSDSFDDNLIPSLETSTTAWKDATAAQAEADKRFATSASQLQTLRNNVDNAAATIGQNLLPVLVDLSKEGVAWLSDPKTQRAIRDFGKDLANGARDAVTWLKGLDWDAIAGAFKSAAGFGKSLIDTFLNAPPWVQQFLAAGFVANKFTGGALGDIVGELGKGLIKGVLGMNAGVVNINAGVVNGAGGLPGVVGGKGGVTSKLGSAANLVGKVFIVGAAAEVASMISGPINQLGKDIGKYIRPAEFASFGDAWETWRKTADWPFGTKNAPDWARTTPTVAPGPLPKTLPSQGAAADVQAIAAGRETRALWAKLPPKLDAIIANTRSVDRGTAKSVAEQIALKRGFAADAARILLEFRSGSERISSSARRAGELAKSGGVIGGNTAARAIDRKDLSVDVDVNTSVNTSISIRDLGRTVTRTNRVNTTARTFL